MKFVEACLLCLLAVEVDFIRDVSAFSSGAPTAACADLTQRHSTNTPVACEPPTCPYTVTLMEIDGAQVSASTNMYRCGSQHTCKPIEMLNV